MSTKKEIIDDLSLKRGKLEHKEHEIRGISGKIRDRSKEIEKKIDELSALHTFKQSDEHLYKIDIDDLVKESDSDDKKGTGGNTFLAFIGGIITGMLIISGL